MKFKLFSKLGSLAGLDLVLFAVAGFVFIALLFGVIGYGKRVGSGQAKPEKVSTRALVYGAMCLTLSFVLSYFKLFSMPFGGSITLLSMLPLMMFANAFGPVMGFMAAFAYALLQIVQGAWIVHPVQFVLDYFVAFICLGIPSVFPEKLPIGVAAGGFARMLVSIVSGAVFFSESGLDYGIANAWVYSFLYNFFTIGVDTVLCLIASCIPKVRGLTGMMR